jgi:sporulation-control protein spo0M
VILAATIAPVELSVATDRVEVLAGAQIPVVVRCLAHRDVSVQSVEVALATKVTYLHKEAGLLGSRFTGTAKRTEVHAVHEVPGPWPLAAGESVALPVTLVVPADAPGTARSPLVGISWVVRVRLHAVGHAYAEVLRSFVVLSRAADRTVVADRPPVIADRRFAALAVEGLSSRYLLPGRPLSGSVAVTPKRPGSARSVQVALVLRQEVHHGEWVGDDPSRNPAFQENDKDTDVAVARLAEALELDPGTTMRLPFTLLVPDDLPAPSLDTPHFTLSWLLRATLDRPLRPNPFVEVELHGRTARD